LLDEASQSSAADALSAVVIAVEVLPEADRRRILARVLSHKTEADADSVARSKPCTKDVCAALLDALDSTRGDTSFNATQVRNTVATCLRWSPDTELAALLESRLTKMNDVAPADAFLQLAFAANHNGNVRTALAHVDQGRAHVGKWETLYAEWLWVMKYQLARNLRDPKLIEEARATLSTYEEAYVCGAEGDALRALPASGAGRKQVLLKRELLTPK
jgi:hypothetical protein